MQLVDIRCRPPLLDPGKLSIFVGLVSVECLLVMYSPDIFVALFHICSDEDWRKRPDRVQTAHQGESLEVGASQRQAGLQKWQAGLHHCHSEASFVCPCFLIICFETAILWKILVTRFMLLDYNNVLLSAQG